MNRWTSTALHEELAVIYRRYPGITHVTSQTEALWRRIEEAEEVEAFREELRKRR